MYCRSTILFWSSLTLFACGETPSSSSLHEKIDALNAVDRLGVPIQFATDPDVLPLQGQSSRAVWSGSWWPLSEGGTTAAMGKYDALRGPSSQARRWEQATVDRNGHVSWAGHCNGLAAAGINEAAPQRGVTYGGQSFSAADIQALLVEKWQGVSRVVLVGQRCDGNMGTDADGRPMNPGCRDINPASFHIVLANILGMRKEPFVVDISVGEQVWNYPVVAYASQVAGLERAEAARLVGANSQGTYAWNPEAEQFMRVQTQLRLASGASMSLEYVLEGRGGRIIGGEWIGASKAAHPDFIWTTATPDPSNPYLDVSVIDVIARLSR